MSGFNTIEMALFINATNTTLITQAKNWLKKHTASNFTKQHEFILDTDPPETPARWIGLAFTTDPGLAFKIKELVDGEPDAKVRMVCRSRQRLKDMISQELEDRGWVRK